MLPIVGVFIAFRTGIPDLAMPGTRISAAVVAVDGFWFRAIVLHVSRRHARFGTQANAAPPKSHRSHVDF